MADGTKIEWTDATWNPITGCQVVSEGCKNCYAMTLAGTRLKHVPSRKGLTRQNAAGRHIWTGEVRFNEKDLLLTLRWTRPRRIFVCAHGDLFAEKVPDEWIDRVFAVMALAPQHTFQVLTKRPERMREYIASRTASRPWERDGMAFVSAGEAGSRRFASSRPAPAWPLPNVWLGTSVEDQATADKRIPPLLDTPAALRWISAEPMLGPIIGIEGLDWVVVGGESGPRARPMHPDWARSLRDQCAAAGVPFLFKQWGAWLPGQNDVYVIFGDGRRVAHWQDGAWGPRDALRPNANYVLWSPDGAMHHGERKAGNYFKVAAWAQRVGKKAAGRLLDGVTHDGMPEASHVA